VGDLSAEKSFPFGGDKKFLRIATRLNLAYAMLKSP
jgi:hypothetical protein